MSAQLSSLDVLPPELLIIIFRESGNVLNIIRCSRRLYQIFIEHFHKPDAKILTVNELRGYIRCVKNVMDPEIALYYYLNYHPLAGYFRISAVHAKIMEQFPGLQPEHLFGGPGNNICLSNIRDFGGLGCPHDPEIYQSHVRDFDIFQIIVDTDYTRHIELIKYYHGISDTNRIDNVSPQHDRIDNVSPQHNRIEYVVRHMPGTIDKPCPAENLCRKKNFQKHLSGIPGPTVARLWRIYASTRFVWPRFSITKKQNLENDPGHSGGYSDMRLSMRRSVDESGDVYNLQCVLLRYFIIDVVFRYRVKLYRSFLDYYFRYNVTNCEFLTGGPRSTDTQRSPEHIIIELLRMKSKYVLEFLNILYEYAPTFPKYFAQIDRKRIYDYISYIDPGMCTFIFKHIPAPPDICDSLRYSTLCGVAMNLRPKKFDIISSYYLACKKNDELAVRLILEHPDILQHLDMKTITINIAYSVSINALIKAFRNARGSSMDY